MTRSAGRAALILVGHGSSGHADAAAPIKALADGIRARARFAEVAAVFLKNPPAAERALDMVGADVAVVVPVFTGRGYYTDTLIPRAMGLAGAVTRRGNRTVLYTPPVGEHPRLPLLLAGRARAAAAAAGFDPGTSTVLLIAHGSSRPGGAGATPRAIAAAIAGQAIFAETVLAFLEQDPKAAEWPSLVTHRDVVVLPLLVAQGMHASEDIPPLFGGGRGTDAAAPAEPSGHRVRIVAGIGAEPELVDIVVAMAEAALATASV
ncbi:MAG: hypothetical protein M0006_07310 [Magnetospirillum sp.]|nr:hypothetical protein [Magnetospirillum sp.]